MEALQYYSMSDPSGRGGITLHIYLNQQIDTLSNNAYNNMGYYARKML